MGVHYYFIFHIISHLIGGSALLSRPRVHVDGPFGSPSEEVFNYEVSVCVAGGIGVTPFACVLQALLWVVRQPVNHASCDIISFLNTGAVF